MAYCDDEAAAFAFARVARGSNWPWLIDVVQAYASVAVFYDLLRIEFDAAVSALKQAVPAGNGARSVRGRLHLIPCCYELGLDLPRVTEHRGRSVDEIVRLHSSCDYSVYAIGFCPGFPYLGYLPEELAGVPRLSSPRVRVEAGSVGLTGRQTGVYTEARPGGWNIVGRTPLVLVDVAAEYFPLRTGDQVRFVPIDEREFERRTGERLEIREQQR
jgi:inhibitor of KinA